MPNLINSQALKTKKIMKKTILLFASLMIVAVAVLTSCGSNDGKLTVLYNITLSEDLAQVADLAVTYKGNNGDNVTETITGTKWEKTIHLYKIPGQFGLVDYKFIPKANAELKKETYELEAELSIFTREQKFRHVNNILSSFTLKRDNVATFFDLVNDQGDLHYLINVTKDKDGLGFYSEENGMKLGF